MTPLAGIRAGSLFSGIGGLDVAVEHLGAEIAWQVEREPFCAEVLHRHWPGVPRYGDIKELDPVGLEPVDLVFGGPPCQPFSTAGKRKVLNDDRWLWPEFARVVRGLRPRLCFVEAPAGLLSPWRDDGRRWRAAPVEAVLGDLAALGFDAQWVCVRASDMGAPHERERVFVLAYTDSGRRRPGQFGLPGRQPDPDRRGQVADTSGGGCGRADHEGAGPAGRGWPPHGGAVAHADGPRPPRRAHPEAAGERPAAPGRGGELPEPRLGRGPDGLPAGLDAHRWPAPQGVEQHPWEPPRTVVAKSLPHRVQRMTALGNAVVPQQAILALKVLWARMEAEAS